MPLYEYYCGDCHTTFDALRPMNKADVAITCQECEGARTARVLSLFAAHTKSTVSAATSQASPAMLGGDCCGGSCGCAQ